MAVAVGRLVGTKGNSFLKSKHRENNYLGRRRNVIVMTSVDFSGMKEEYEILRLSPGATEKDVKRAFRRLALQTVMSNLAQTKQQNYSPDYHMEDLMGVNNDPWDEWEEWMGWEGAVPPY